MELLVVCPVRVSVIDPHDLVVAGVTTLLSQFPDRVRRADWWDPSGVDVVLYGVHAETVWGHDAQLHALLRGSRATVLAFGWDPDSPGAVLADACGAHAFVPKQLPAPQLIGRIEDLHHACDDGTVLPVEGACHPEVESSGLSGREIDVLSMIAMGQSNLEIADELFLSINSVKTYVKFAYRKIGVNRRSQAVIWSRQHGLGTALAAEHELMALMGAEGAKGMRGSGEPHALTGAESAWG